MQAVQRRIELRRKTLPVLPEGKVDTVMCMPCCLQHFAARTDHARMHGMQAASAHAWLLKFGARSQPLYAQCHILQLCEFFIATSKGSSGKLCMDCMAACRQQRMHAIKPKRLDDPGWLWLRG